MWASVARVSTGFGGRRRTKNLGYYFKALDRQAAAAAAPSVEALPAAPAGHARPRAFLDLSIGEDAKPQRITIELADDIVPKTVSNFLKLCEGSASDANGYKGSKIHNIRRGFGLSGGDYVLANGRGGRSADGDDFADENFVGRHTEPGTISMANSGVDSNSSVFFISTAACPHLDGRHVVFGKVVEGLPTVEAATGVLQVNGNPSVPLTIAAAGTVDAESR